MPLHHFVYLQTEIPACANDSLWRAKMIDVSDWFKSVGPLMRLSALFNVCRAIIKTDCDFTRHLFH